MYRNWPSNEKKNECEKKKEENHERKKKNNVHSDERNLLIRKINIIKGKSKFY